jgi:hypothetical protein
VNDFLSSRILPLVDKGPTFRRYILSRSFALGSVEMEVVFCSETLVYGIVANKTITVLKIILAILFRTTVGVRFQWIWGERQFMCET